MQEKKVTRHRLKQCRQMAGLTQAEVGQRLGVGAAAVNKWERGVTDMGISQVPRLAEIYGVKPGDLFESPTERTGMTIDQAKTMARLADVHWAAFAAVDFDDWRRDEARELSKGYELVEKLPEEARQKWVALGEFLVLPT